jgi:hypothetical protein
MARAVICCALLVGFIAGMKWLLNFSFDGFGLWVGLAICIAIAAVCLVIARVVDNADNRSRAETPPRPRDYR